MANALINFGLNKHDVVLDPNFSSQTLANGNTAPTGTGVNSVRITALTGNVYVAFGNTTVVANASIDPRAWVGVGQTLSFSCKPGTVITVLDA